MKKDYSESIAAQMQATLASPEHLALFAQTTAEADDKCSKCKKHTCECDSHSVKDSKEEGSDSCMVDDNADKDAPAGGASGSGAPGDPMKFTPDPKLDVVKAKPPQSQKADDAAKNDKHLYNDKAHADDGSSASYDDDATLAFDTAIGSLLSASSALDAAGMVKSATLSLELAQFVVEAKKKMKDKKKLKKKKMDSGKSKSDSKKSDSKKSDSKKSDSKKSDSKSTKK